VLCDRDPADNWVDGRVAVLGDAAHPQLQYFAQGACMAMEDAVALAHVMADGFGDIEKKLNDYQKMRRTRTARIQLQSREIGDHIYHPAGAHAELRNQIMSSKSPEDWYDILSWVYGSSGLDGAVSKETLAAR